MIKTRREIIMRFVFDLDGTICFRGKPLSLKMVEALDLLVAEGHDVSFASARPIRDLLPILPPHLSQFPMVGGNGAFVYKDGRAVAIHHFSPGLAEAVRELLQRFEADYLADGDWNYSFLCDYEHPILKNVDPGKQARQLPLNELETIVKVVVLGAKDMTGLYDELNKLSVHIYSHGTESIFDISPQGIDKWTGLQELGMQPSDFIAFGNDSNDIPMFRAASRAICVGDHEDLKKAATMQVAATEEEVIAAIHSIRIELQTQGHLVGRNH
jgi:Cof subfamily protein (haloacid dehalogenase superfamily)